MSADVMDVLEDYQVRLADVDSLVPYARNSRQHAPSQVAQIKASMVEWGFTNPILADLSAGNQIVAGHGRQVAAQELLREGVELTLPGGRPLPRGKVPVIDCSGWTDAQRRAYVIADNKIALNSTWDIDALISEFEDLQAVGYDLSLTGFSADELEELLVEEIDPDKDPDEVPDVPEEPYSKYGDMWVCGPHRVRCGDSTKQEDWNALMQGELADLQVCDPPYNVAYESKLAGSIKNDDMSDSAFYQFLLGFYSCSFAVMKPGAAMYVAHADSEGANFRNGLKAAGFSLKACLMWVKNSLVLGRGDFHYRHEPILYGTKPGAPRNWYSDRKQTTVQQLGESSPFQQMEDGRWAVVHGDTVMYVSGDAVVEEAPSSLLHFDKPRRSAMHPTTKPVALWEKLAAFNGRRGDIVIDGFGGSGTTMVMADRMGMYGRLMEFDPRFVDVIAVRYAMMTGRVPVHAETGEPFPQEVIDRLSPKVSG